MSEATCNRKLLLVRHGLLHQRDALQHLFDLLRKRLLLLLSMCILSHNLAALLLLFPQHALVLLLLCKLTVDLCAPLLLLDDGLLQTFVVRTLFLLEILVCLLQSLRVHLLLLAMNPLLRLAHLLQCQLRVLVALHRAAVRLLHFFGLHLRVAIADSPQSFRLGCLSLLHLLSALGLALGYALLRHLLALCGRVVLVESQLRVKHHASLHAERTSAHVLLAQPHASSHAGLRRSRG